MFSQTAEHALRAILFLAQGRPGEPVSAEVIAGSLGAPQNYLAKTLNALAKHGILASMRGPTGGFWLETPASELSLAQVVRAFDEPRQQSVCLLGGRPCTDRAPCAAHSRWKRVAEEVWAPLERTTIADLLRRETLEISIPGIAAGTPSQPAPAV